MLRLLVLMISIGLADSINPSTIAPALYLASGERPRSRVAEFTLAVFVVYLAGGALIALGLGGLIRHAVPDIDVRRTVRYSGELLAGVLLLAGAALMWRRRHRMVARGLPSPTPERRSSILLGVTITAVELPTAFPYFAAIAAVVGSGLDPARKLVLLLVFNVCFILPLLAILLTLLLPGDHAERILTRGRVYLERRWPHILCALIVIVGLIAIFFGATGLATGIHGRVGRFFRHVRHHLHLRL
ncbi:MAG TPA: GAP family protein [Solirubrobacteraceae bacterium]|nr:GAP family protein [Solirubrobacteraceae bacterium]